MYMKEFFKNIKNWPLARKIGVSILVIVALLAIVTGLGFFNWMG